MITFRKAFAVVLTGGVLFSQSAYAEKPKTITATNWMASVHVLNNENYQKWATDVEEKSNGRA